MKRKVAWSLLTLVILVGAFLTYTQSASSSSSNQHIAIPRAVPETSNLIPAFATTFDVDRTDDTAAETACTAAPNDCSLRGAIIAANADVSATPVIINLQPATTYNLTTSSNLDATVWSSAVGDVFILGSGTFTTTGLVLKANQRFIGAGITNTTVALDTNTISLNLVEKYVISSLASASNVEVADLTADAQITTNSLPVHKRMSLYLIGSNSHIRRVKATRTYGDLQSGEECFDIKIAAANGDGPSVGSIVEEESQPAKSTKTAEAHVPTGGVAPAAPPQK